ncbi:MAG: hydroxymyristoyl-ACP dehydratase [Gammaproteobacteria bacterium]|nr:hydroxymyristoyl-ACP dehydratase [Gammaproteobacteria bacterium]
MVKAIKPIEHDELCSLIPHSFDMCLLDRVESWDENTITCYSHSHHLASNPLRRNETLSSVHLLEYAAQAMAVHGGLHDREQGIQMREGYLAALRDIKIELLDIQNLETELHIEATKILSQGGNMIYRFTVFAGENTLASGRATVVSISNS